MIWYVGIEKRRGRGVLTREDRKYLHTISGRRGGKRNEHEIEFLCFTKSGADALFQRIDRKLREHGRTSEFLVFSPDNISLTGWYPHASEDW